MSYSTRAVISLAKYLFVYLISYTSFICPYISYQSLVYSFTSSQPTYILCLYTIISIIYLYICRNLILLWSLLYVYVYGCMIWVQKKYTFHDFWPYASYRQTGAIQYDVIGSLSQLNYYMLSLLYHSSVSRELYVLYIQLLMLSLLRFSLLIYSQSASIASTILMLHPLYYIAVSYSVHSSFNLLLSSYRIYHTAL